MKVKENKQGNNLTLSSQNIKYFALILTIHCLIPFKLDNNYKIKKKNCFWIFWVILVFEISLNRKRY